MKKLNKEELNRDVDFEKVNAKAKSFWTEFKEFAVKGNAVDLAIGVVIGGAFTTIVNSLVDDVIMPCVGKLTGGFDFSKLFIALDGNHYETLADAQAAEAAVITYGNFITSMINFLIIALVIFIVFKKLLCGKKKVEEAPAAPTTKECPYCKSTINIDATRCPHCTSELK